jgi:hypothetical protein
VIARSWVESLAAVCGDVPVEQRAEFARMVTRFAEALDDYRDARLIGLTTRDIDAYAEALATTPEAARRAAMRALDLSDEMPHEVAS